MSVGNSLGARDGFLDGDREVWLDGISDGKCDGDSVGVLDGDCEFWSNGVSDGNCDGVVVCK